MAEPVVFKGVSKVFRDFWRRPVAQAVTALDFTLHEGETLAFLGPNGSGKSTSVKMLLGLLHPTSGEIALYGRPPTDVKIKRRIGYLAEETRLYPWLNARETLMFFGSLFGLPRGECRKRTDELLEMTGLAHAAHRKVGTFSKGMQRRIGIAQALINDPDLLIFDEPTSGLDPIGIVEVRDVIHLLKSRGKSILLTGHMLTDIEAVCDRVIILHGGRICAEGSIEELLTDDARLRLEFPEIPEPGLSAIRNAIAAQLHTDEEITISHPKRSLEELFADAVANARADEDNALVNDGVRRAGPTAPYLREAPPQ